jgi:DNA-binding NarL/FixJ family response regulator
MHVLLVDDSASVRARLAAMLGEFDDLIVTQASAAAEALELVLAQRFQVVVLDIHMPGENGLELLSRLGHAAPEALVIVLSNETSEHHRRECMARGANGFLDKSREFQRLPGLIRELTATDRS